MGKKVFLPKEVIEEILYRKKKIGNRRDALHLAISSLLDEVEKENEIEIVWNKRFWFGKIYVRNSNLERLRQLATKYNCSYGRVLLSYLQKKKKEGIMGYLS
ncbi:hypothetical protein STIV2_C101 [Sulfolobus turreted icosahedral virus 2]|uniref:Uncharacterized protein n=1 Tax=Sulfolobus turreted icosahedral virus 2 TaxID=754004 RepID=D5IEZ0_9VIRU|nr:hypothetical protein STIV2_C101 [Sulfolobus turreted icosahedral virus 2]ADF27762.1 hypothetical protein STIV2_C101 [Sulfolobus turreted icosahedral virus 2]